MPVNDDLDNFGKSIYTISNDAKPNSIKVRNMLNGGDSDFNGPLPSYYRAQLNKIMEQLVCQDQKGKWVVDDKTKEFDMTSCGQETIVGKLLAAKGPVPDLKTATNNINKIIKNLYALRRTLIGSGGGIQHQAKYIMGSDINLSKDQQILLTKLDELQKFKKYGAVEQNELTYTGKSKNILELIYYISGISIMILFIINQSKLVK